MRLPTSSGWIGLTVGGLLLIASPAFAHKLLTSWKVDGGRVRVEAFFDDDTPAQEAQVVVTDAADRTVAEGRTDERGVWSFARPAAGSYSVRVESVGHRATARIKVPQAASATEKNRSALQLAVGSVAVFAEDQAPLGLVAGSAASVGPAGGEAGEASSAASGPSREELTRTPWLKIGVGMAAIAGLTVALRLASRRTRSAPLPGRG